MGIGPSPQKRRFRVCPIRDLFPLPREMTFVPTEGDGVEGKCGAAAEGQFTFLPPVLLSSSPFFLFPPSFLVLPSAADSICRLLLTPSPPSQ